MKVVTDILVGTEFELDGTVYAFAGQNKTKTAINAYRIHDMTPIRLSTEFTLDDLRKCVTGKINEAVAEVYSEMDGSEGKSNPLIKELSLGQHFKAIDNQTYIYVRTREKRFEFRTFDNTVFLAYPNFIKEVLPAREPITRVRKNKGRGFEILLVEQEEADLHYRETGGLTIRNGVPINSENKSRPKGSEHCRNCWQLHMPDKYGLDELCEDCATNTLVERYSEL